MARPFGERIDVVPAGGPVPRPGRSSLLPVVRIELSPVEWDLGVSEVTDADLEAG